MAFAHECRGGLLGLVRQDLGVNEPGMVVQRVVQECVAADLPSVPGSAFSEIPGPGIRFTLHPPVDAVSATVGDPAELLDVHVDHLARPRIFVPAGGVRAADPDPRCRVGEPQRRAEIADQDAVNRGDVQVQMIGDPGRAPLPVHPQSEHTSLGAHPGPVRAGRRPAPAVLQPNLSQLSVAAGPARGRRNGNVEPLSSPAQRPPINMMHRAADAPNEPKTRYGGTQGPPGLCSLSTSTTQHPKVLLLLQINPRVTNLPGQYI